MSFDRALKNDFTVFDINASPENAFKHIWFKNYLQKYNAASEKSKNTQNYLK